jgi:outer membrane protein OmpA-like peptidoglycan-associated protein
MSRRLALGLVAAVALTGCAGGAAMHDTAQVAPVRNVAHATSAAQLTGSHDFALCEAPHCPQPTPKTPGAPATQESIRPHAGQATSIAVQLDFEPGQAQLADPAKNELERVVALAHDVGYVRITGETGRGIRQEETTEALAIARARSVRDYLRSRHPRIAPVIELATRPACCEGQVDARGGEQRAPPRVELLMDGAQPDQ